MRIRPLSPADLPSVADIHLAAFPAAAISRMGREAARRFYESLLRGPHDAVGFGAVDENDQLVGYCFAGVWEHAEEFYLRQNVLYLVGRVALRPWLLLHPYFVNRVWLALRLLVPVVPLRNTYALLHEDGADRFGIQSVAVHPDAQGRGAAKELLQASAEVARQRGFRTMELSVHVDNAQAIAVYERLGWQRILTRGRWHGFMALPLDGPR